MVSSELSFGGRPVVGFGLGIFADEVDGDIAELDPSMVSLNTAVSQCAAMAASDVTLWTQAYDRWQKLKSDWAFDKQGSIAPGPVYGSGIESRIQLSRNDYASFQGKVAQACASLAPPVIAPTGTPPGSTNWVEDIKSAGKVIAGLAVTGVVIYGVYEGVKIVSSLSKK